MGSIDDIMQLCRLCLVKDQVNIPIFDETSDIRQTFLKINQCLPVKVSRDDNLPKKICDGCSYKLDMLYVFRNTSVDSEKQLMSWLSQAGLGSCSLPQTLVKDGVTKPEIMVKQETFEATDVRLEGDNPELHVDTHQELGVDAHSYIMQQQKLPYQQDFAAFGEPSGSTNIVSEEPPPKKAKRAAATKKHVPLETEVDEALDNAMQITKAEEEDSDDVDQPDYVEAPSTSADDQPGPSGVGKGTIEAPSEDSIKLGDHKSTIVSDLCDIKEEIVASPKNIDKYTTCRQCVITFSTRNLLRKHYRDVHWKKNFPCVQCGAVLKTKGSLQKHMEIHSSEMLYFCEVCKKHLRTNRQLDYHRNFHRKARIPCPDCDKTFASEPSLKKHQNRHHQSHEVACEFCGKKYSGIYADCELRKHIKMVHDREQSLCDICGKNVKCLKEHLTMHSGVKPYICDKCNKSFSQKKYLKVHVRVHTKEKPFSCDLCEKKYSQRNALTFHIRAAHTGEKPYGCHVCPKRFVSRTSLNSHLRRHAN